VDRVSSEGPAARRPFFWRRHRAFLILLAVAVPATIAFSWQEVIASLGDDSVSYLTLARYLSPFSSDPLIAPWAKYHSHFPPLFPLLLVFTGGAQDLLAAHLAVGACALLALAFVYRYASLRLGGALAGVFVALLFLLTPSAWVSIRGILSEPLYLALSLAALIYHDRRLEAGGGKRELLVFGLLVAAAYLARVAGIALIAAYAAHVAVRAIARRKLPTHWTLVPLVLPFALAALWLFLRPRPDMDNYGLTLHAIAEHWLKDPGVAAISTGTLLGGWMASFTGHSGVGSAMRLFFGALGFMGVIGALLGARRNRLDSWYVLASLAMLFLWVFPEDNSRRLLYPVLPLLLVHAAEALAAACAPLKMALHERRVLLAGWAFVAVMTMPATLLVLEKALDRETLVPGFAYTPSGMTPYYSTVNIAQARALAGEHAAMLAGLESLDRVTPPGSRVMWMRPEYVALLGRRPGVAWYHGWDRATLAREIRRTETGYLIAARLFKSDLAGHDGDAFAALAVDPPPYLRAAFVITAPGTTGQEFVLLEVDRAALDRYISTGGA
jgi:4-amino-4-deoxy-L-arabinose transferase-like glycosyltransferase